MVPQCLAWCHSVWYGATVFGMVPQRLVWCHSVWDGATVFGMVVDDGRMAWWCIKGCREVQRGDVLWRVWRLLM